MKKVFFVSLMAIGLVTVFNTAALSQTTLGLITKMQVVVERAEAGGVIGNERVNTRVIRDFLKSYPTVTGEQWFRYEDRYMVFFDSSDIRYRIEYDEKGNWGGTEKMYKESLLDRGIRKIVKSVYFDFDITGVQEITLPAGSFTGPVYIIHLEGKHSFKNVCVYDGEMSVLNQFTKAL